MIVLWEFPLSLPIRLVCGGGDDAGCVAGLVGAPGAPLWRVGPCCWCRCTWLCAVLGGCRRGVAGCCVLCFLFRACVPLLTVCMLCSSYLYSGFFCATLDAPRALRLVLHLTAPIDVSKSLNQTSLRIEPPQTWYNCQDGAVVHF